MKMNGSYSIQSVMKMSKNIPIAKDVVDDD